ncbi:MAG: hypothetical protein KJZ86_19640 [Caldilineaceae bacterium]|nr:hypothetical protein [Caldilineaceae bacterium]
MGAIGGLPLPALHSPRLGEGPGVRAAQADSLRYIDPGTLKNTTNAIDRLPSPSPTHTTRPPFAPAGRGAGGEGSAS